MAGGAESRCLWTPHHTENLPASRPLDIRPHQRGAARTCCRSRVPPPVLALRAGRFPGRRTGPASRANLGTPHNGHTRVLKRGGYALCVILCRSHSPVHVQHETLSTSAQPALAQHGCGCRPDPAGARLFRTACMMPARLGAYRVGKHRCSAPRHSAA